MMKRSVFSLLGFAALIGILFGGAFALSNRICLMRATQSTDELAWLKREFKLSATEMARIEQLHAGYLPRCAEMCAEIAAKRAELEIALADTTNLTPQAENKLAELAALRARCQAQMLQHFADVSQAMPPAQGRRYLTEMQRLTLGDHEKFERSMSGSSGHAH